MWIIHHYLQLYSCDKSLPLSVVLVNVSPLSTKNPGSSRLMSLISDIIFPLVIPCHERGEVPRNEEAQDFHPYVPCILHIYPQSPSGYHKTKQNKKKQLKVRDKILYIPKSQIPIFSKEPDIQIDSLSLRPNCHHLSFIEQFVKAPKTYLLVYDFSILPRGLG